MRFSDTPLWWRLLVIAVTLAVGWVVYWLASAATDLLSDSAAIIVAAVIMTTAVVVLIVERRRRSANRERGQIAKPLRQRRD